MIQIVLANTDLARVRFAHSPVQELVASLRVLHDPGRQQLFGRWLAAVQDRLQGLRLDLLTALAPTGRYLPAFLLPPPTQLWPLLADQLDAIAATPPAAVRAELDKARRGGPLPGALRPLYQDPATHLPTVVQQLQRYWQAALQPVWERVRALCMTDLAYRMEQFAASGLAVVLDGLHPDVAFERDRLQLHKPQQCHHHVDLAGAGILLVPCVFTWPTLSIGCTGVEQPMLVYPPRGVAALWQEPPAARPDPLAALVGRTRATLLATVDLPRTTSQLAAQLGLSPAAVSQHLQILKQAALVTARRRGRLVLYQRTAAATALLAAIHSDQATG